MIDPALMSRWERTFWWCTLKAFLLLYAIAKWFWYRVLGLPRCWGEEWINSMSDAEYRELRELAELVERAEVPPAKPSQPSVPLSRSIFDHKDCGRYLDQLRRRP